MKNINMDITKGDIIAVVGVSSNPDKYGYKVFFDLIGKGYKVYAIHPDGGELNGHIRYKSLKDLPEVPTLVSIVVPPNITEEIVKECYILGVKRVWMQPGSESEKAIKFCKENGIEVLYGACIMIRE